MKKNRMGRGFHMLAKPIGPVCNLDCTYCFYIEKRALFAGETSFKMSDVVLETFIKKYIQAQDIPEIQFVWQGGEPTLLGIPYYRKIIDYQKKYANGKKIINSIQTNGVLLDEQWCQFLKANDFLVGLSLDGPQDINDHYRKDCAGKPTFDRVLEAVQCMQRIGVKFNVLACVTKASQNRGKQVYDFFKELGIKHIQFSPVVERLANDRAREIGLRHAVPNVEVIPDQSYEMTDFSVEQGAYGAFLVDVFDEWIQTDVGDVFVSNFEWALQSWMGLPSTVCVFSKTCGKALAVEHDGSIYACDHYVYPEYRLGNLLTDSPAEIAYSNRANRFGERKSQCLPSVCKSCEVGFACNGECPRHRFVKSGDGQVGLSYLCRDYKHFFTHIHRYMKVMVQLIEKGLPASRIMDALKGPIAVYIEE